MFVLDSRTGMEDRALSEGTASEGYSDGPQERGSAAVLPSPIAIGVPNTSATPAITPMALTMDTTLSLPSGPIDMHDDISVISGFTEGEVRSGLPSQAEDAFLGMLFDDDSDIPHILNDGWDDMTPRARTKKLDLMIKHRSEQLTAQRFNALAEGNRSVLKVPLHFSRMTREEILYRKRKKHDQRRRRQALEAEISRRNAESYRASEAMAELQRSLEEQQRDINTQRAALQSVLNSLHTTATTTTGGAGQPPPTSRDPPPPPAGTPPTTSRAPPRGSPLAGPHSGRRTCA